MKDLTQLFDQLIIKLEKKKVPATVKRYDNQIVIEAGWNYPSSICRKVFPIISELTGEVNTEKIALCAEISGGTILQTKYVCGGAKRYNRR